MLSRSDPAERRVSQVPKMLDSEAWCYVSLCAILQPKGFSSVGKGACGLVLLWQLHTRSVAHLSINPFSLDGNWFAPSYLSID